MDSITIGITMEATKIGKRHSIGTIDPAIHKRARQYALSQETTLRAVVETALKLYLPPVKKERAR